MVYKAAEEKQNMLFLNLFFFFFFEFEFEVGVYQIRLLDLPELKI